jgi:hypothetical protein
MPPKPGNAFAQQKEAKRLNQVRKELEHVAATTGSASADIESEDQGTSRPSAEDTIRTTFLEVPMITQPDEPSTAATTMTAIIGPETEREKHGREMIQQQRDSMLAKIKHKHSHKTRRRSIDSSGTVIKHASAMPAPLFRGKFGQVINKFKGKKAEAVVATGDPFDKPLPTISSPEAAYARAHGTYIPGAYIPSPAYVQGDTSMGTSPTFGPSSAIPFKTDTQPYSPNQYTQSQPRNEAASWPLPSGRGAAPGQLLAQTFETRPSQCLHTGNSAMIFSNHLLTPTRAGDFAIFGQPSIVHPPSMMSMSASFVDPPLSPADHAAADQRTSTLGVVPEVQENTVLQAARSSSVEKLYRQTSSNSQSEKPPIILPVPRIHRSLSLPNVTIAPFSLEPAAATPAPASQSSLIALHADLKSTRRSTTRDLAVLSAQLRGMQNNNNTIAFLQDRVHAIDARTQRIEDKLDAVVEGFGLGNVVGRRVPIGMFSGSGGGVSGVGMEERLAAPGPHLPWGRGLDLRDREQSAGIGGGLEGARAWYRAARLA